MISLRSSVPFLSRKYPISSIVLSPRFIPSIISCTVSFTFSPPESVNSGLSFLTPTILVQYPVLIFSPFSIGEFVRQAKSILLSSDGSDAFFSVLKQSALNLSIIQSNALITLLFVVSINCRSEYMSFLSIGQLAPQTASSSSKMSCIISSIRSLSSS